MGSFGRLVKPMDPFSEWHFKMHTVKYINWKRNKEYWKRIIKVLRKTHLGYVNNFAFLLRHQRTIFNNGPSNYHNFEVVMSKWWIWEIWKYLCFFWCYAKGTLIMKGNTKLQLEISENKINFSAFKFIDLSNSIRLKSFC